MGVRRDRDRWVGEIAAFAASKRTVSEFCSRRGINEQTFRWWRWKLSAAKAPGTAVRMLPVTVTDTGPTVAVGGGASRAAGGDRGRGALIRQNSLFFGNEDAGRKYMVLLTLIATCEKHDVNPEVYLTDVMIRIQHHPKNRLAELLPHRWKLLHGSGFKVDRVETPKEAA